MENYGHFWYSNACQLRVDKYPVRYRHRFSEVRLVAMKLQLAAMEMFKKITKLLTYVINKSYSIDDTTRGKNQ